MALSQLKERLTPGEWFWFDTPSLNHFEQARPIIERLKKEHTQTKIIITVRTDHALQILQSYPQADYITYLPSASLRNVKKFLDIVNPQKAVFVGNNFSTTYLRQLRKRNINTYSIGSVFQSSLKHSLRRQLKYFTSILVQDQQSKDLLEQYKITNSQVCGNPRFDSALQIAQSQHEYPLIEKFIAGMPEYQTMQELLNQNHQPILVAGSTSQTDEQILAQYIKQNPNIRLILVPHIINSQRLSTIFRIFEGRYILLSQATHKNIDTAHILVIDNYGMLNYLYRYASVAYIGGGFQEGVHNPIQAAAHAVPLVFGNKSSHLKEATELLQANAAIAIPDPTNASDALNQAFQNAELMGQNALQYVLLHKDATDMTYTQLGL